MLRPAPAKLPVPGSNGTAQHATRPTVFAANEAEQRAVADAAKAAAQQEAKRAAADKSKRRATEKATRLAAESAFESAAAATEALYEALRLQQERLNAGNTERVERWEALLVGESAMPSLSVDPGMDRGIVYKEPQPWASPEPPGARTHPAAADGLGPSTSSPVPPDAIHRLAYTAASPILSLAQPLDACNSTASSTTRPRIEGAEMSGLSIPVDAAQSKPGAAARLSTNKKGACQKLTATLGSMKAAQALSRASSGQRLAASLEPQGPVRVQLSLTVRRIWAVDLSEQTFCAAITCFTYHESHKDDGIPTSSGETRLQLVNGDRAWASKHFSPALRIANATSQDWGAWQFMLSPEQGRNGRRMLTGTTDVVATIRQTFALGSFPFDLQSLEINVNLEADPSVAHLVPMRPNKSDGTPHVADVAYDAIHLSDLQFVPYLPHANGIRTMRSLPPNEGSHGLHSEIGTSQAYVTIPVARAPDHYVRTFGAVLFLAGLIICSLFAIPASSPRLRLASDLGLSFIVAITKLFQSHLLLPRVSELTRLDRLALAVFALLVVVVWCHILVAIISTFSVETAGLVELGAWIGCTVCWMSYIAWWLWSSYGSLRVQHDRMRATLKSLNAQHGLPVTTGDGTDWPGATAADPANKGEQRGKRMVPRVPLPGSVKPTRSLAAKPRSMV